MPAVSPPSILSEEDRQTGFCTPGWQHAEEKADVNLVICLESERTNLELWSLGENDQHPFCPLLGPGSERGGPTQVLWQLGFQREKGLY